MSGKQEKKKRRMYRKEVKEHVDKIYGEIDVVKESLKRLIRQKPWWAPKWLWRRIVKYVINIEV